MKQENYALLNELLDDYIQQREEIHNLIRTNLLRIEESEHYLKSIYEQEDKNFKVFSPRDIETQHKDEIGKQIDLKKKYEQTIEKYKDTLEEVNRNIGKLQSVIESEGSSDIWESVNAAESVDAAESVNAAVSVNAVESINAAESSRSSNRDKNLAVLNIQEEERQRIARDLHDTSLQTLTHLIHKIELSTKYIDEDPTKAKLELAIVSKNIKEIVEEIRDTIFNLRPMSFDDLGIKYAIERLFSKFNENNQFEIETDIEDVSCENDLVLVTIYRVIRECVINAVSHSQGSNIFFSMKNVNGICMILLQDDGRGFIEEHIQEKKESHFGLSVMRERINLLGGKMEMDSSEGGTQVKISIPLN